MATDARRRRRRRPRRGADRRRRRPIDDADRRRHLALEREASWPAEDRRRRWPASSTCSKPASRCGTDRDGCESAKETRCRPTRRPLRDMRFVLHELHDIAALRDLPGCEDIDAELIDTHPRGGGKVLRRGAAAAQRAAATRRAAMLRERRRAHAEGLHARPITPSARAAGPSLARDPAYGGQGLPESRRQAGRGDDLLRQPLLRPVSRPDPRRLCGAASHGTRGAEAALTCRSWSTAPGRGTMCLTEAHCGTDLGLMRTKAVPQHDGSYRITGTQDLHLAPASTT